MEGGVLPSIHINTSFNSLEEGDKEEEEDEEKEEKEGEEENEEEKEINNDNLPCNRFSLPAHLGIHKNSIPAEFDRLQEGLSIYAAFYETSLNFVNHKKLNSQQIAQMNKILKNTLEEDLGICVSSSFSCIGKSSLIKNNRKRQKVKGDNNWYLNGSLISYHKEGRKMYLIINNANVQTQGLVLPSQHLIISSIDNN